MFTHTSIAVGEDGPTHQPVAHLASLRAIPGLIILRPADAAEVLEAWKVIMQFRHEPVAFDLDPTGSTNVGPHQVCIGRRAGPGAYVLADRSDGNPDVLLLATGSEVAFCVELQLRRTASRPGSSACRPGRCSSTIAAKILSTVTASYLWERYVGTGGRTTLGMRTFGASAGRVAEVVEI